MKDIDYSAVAGRIKASRESVGFNQSELAHRIGATKGAISQWESGKPISYKADNWLRMASVLRKDPYWLLYGDRPKIISSPAVQQIQDMFDDGDLSEGDINALLEMATRIRRSAPAGHIGSIADEQFKRPANGKKKRDVG